MDLSYISLEAIWTIWLERRKPYFKDLIRNLAYVDFNLLTQAFRIVNLAFGGRSVVMERASKQGHFEK